MGRAGGLVRASPTPVYGKTLPEPPQCGETEALSWFGRGRKWDEKPVLGCLCTAGDEKGR